MKQCFMRYTSDGYLVILPEDDPRLIVDAMLETGYSEEFCISPAFDPDFIARLMEAGFLVMSAGFRDEGDDNDFYILLPKLHLTRSALFFENLHIKKSVKRYLNRYELRADSDFDYIVDRCVEIHGNDWLTPPLVDAIRTIREKAASNVRPVSFSLYRDGKPVAGEFGVRAGGVYTSYSGYYDESNAGTVQLILTARYLQDNGYAFFDLGMPLGYKTALGATDISPEEFVRRFR
jgi:Leu/Phe-tRNA-protein transferase